MATILMNMHGLPAELQQNPVGAAIFAGLVVLALLCWLAVTWLKHRR